MSLISKRKYRKLLNKINHKSLPLRFMSFLAGCFLISISYNIFLVENKIVPGGVGGIAIILNSIFTIENWKIILISNIILLTISYFTLEKEQTKASIIGSLLLPVFIYLTQNINVWLEIDATEKVLSTVFGGVIYGFGAGLVFKAGFTTGGTDIINQIISKYAKISIGNSMLLSDGLIVLSSAIFFGPMNLLYSIIVLYIISLMSDKVILGISDNKAFYIITEKEEEVKDYIFTNLGHSVTIFNAKGGFKKEKENVLLCVLPTRDYYKLKEGIHEIDKEAFFVVTDAYEVFGGE